MHGARDFIGANAAVAWHGQRDFTLADEAERLYAAYRPVRDDGPGR